MGNLIIPDSLLREANATRELQNCVHRKEHREPFVVDGVVVGFYTPHQTRLKWRWATKHEWPYAWELGPAYVQPAYRRRGLLLSIFNLYWDRPMIGFSADDNEASIGIHKAAGFHRWKRHRTGYFYARDAR